MRNVLKATAKKLYIFFNPSSVYRTNDLVEGLYTPRVEHTLW